MAVARQGPSVSLEEADAYVRLMENVANDRDSTIALLKEELSRANDKH
jgi:hypothetical protein